MEVILTFIVFTLVIIACAIYGAYRYKTLLNPLTRHLPRLLASAGG